MIILHTLQNSGSNTSTSTFKNSVPFYKSIISVAQPSGEVPAVERALLLMAAQNTNFFIPYVDFYTFVYTWFKSFDLSLQKKSLSSQQ